MEYSWEKYAVQTDPPAELLKPLQVQNRILMAPGPCQCSERVLKSLRLQIVGFNTELQLLMEEIKAGIRYAFQTRNKLTLAVTGAGHAAMEACFGNLIEPGEVALITKSGIWSERAIDMAKRLTTSVEILESELGVPFDLDTLENALKKYRPTVVFMVHGESTSGMRQPLEGIGDLVHRYNALLIVDCVASLGGEPFFMDAWGIDVAYSSSQKALGAPPGITPISFSPLAVDKIFKRRTKATAYYWDMSILGNQWNCFGCPMYYHHTPSITLMYGLREALAELAEESLPVRWFRYASLAEKLRGELQKRGLRFVVKNPKHQLCTVTAIELPHGIDGEMILQRTIERFNVEMSDGIGPTEGNTIRIGLMGANVTSYHVDLVIRALDEALTYAESKI